MTTFDKLAELQGQMTPEQKKKFEQLNGIKSTPRPIDYSAALNFFEGASDPDEILGGAQQFAESHMGVDDLEAVYGAGKVPQDPKKIAEDFTSIAKPYVNHSSVVYQTKEQFDARVEERAQELRDRASEDKKTDVQLGMGYVGQAASVEDLALVENSFKLEDFTDEATEQLLKDDRLASVVGISNGLSKDTLYKARLAAFLAEDTPAVRQIASTVPVDERADFAALIQLSTPAEHNVLKYFQADDMLEDVLRAADNFLMTQDYKDGVGPAQVYSVLQKEIGRENLDELFHSVDVITGGGGGISPHGFASEESREAVRSALKKSRLNRVIDDQGRLTVDPEGEETLRRVDDALDKIPALYHEAKQFYETQDLERKIQEALRPRRPDEVNLLFDLTASTMELAPFTAGTAAASFLGGPTAGFAFAYSAQKDSINAHYQSAGFDPITADMMSSAILVPIASLEYLGASRFFKTGVGKGMTDAMSKNYWRISGQLLQQRGIGFASEVLTEGGQRFLEDVVLTVAQEYADVEGYTLEEVMQNSGNEMKEAFKGMLLLSLVPGARDQGYLALHKATSGRASAGDVGTMLDLEHAMQSFSKQRDDIISRHTLEQDEQGHTVVDLVESDSVTVPIAVYDNWKASTSSAEQDLLLQNNGLTSEHMEVLQEKEKVLADQARQKIGELAFETARDFDAKRMGKITERIQSRIDDGLTKDQVLTELIQKYAPGESFNVVTVDSVEDLMDHPDVIASDKTRFAQSYERTGKYPNVEGFVSGKTAFLVNDNLASPAAAVAKFAHEALGHLGVDAQGKFRQDVLTEAATILEQGGFLQSWGQMLVNLNPEFYGPQFTTDGVLDPLKLADEVIARYAEAMIDGRDLSVQQRNTWQKLRDFAATQLHIESASEWTDRSMAELVTGLMRGGRDADAGAVADTRFSVTEASSEDELRAEADRLGIEFNGYQETGDLDIRFPLFTDVEGTKGTFGLNDGETVERALNRQREAFGFKPRFSVAPPTDSEAFKNWFGDSKVVDENGAPLVVYHGTTHDFSVFSTKRADIENDFGLGFYFSNSSDDVYANYEGLGPDLTQRIEQLAERIESDENVDYDVAKTRAEKQLKGEAERVLEIYLSLKDPVIVGGDNETIFELEYSEDTEEESGTYVELAESLRDVSFEFEEVKIDQAISDMFENTGYDSATVSEIITALKASEGIMYATDEVGNLASSELIRRAFEDMGYDGIIDGTVYEKFGGGRSVGQKMDGVYSDTTHYIAFSPAQIKSVDNRGTFDPENPDIRYSIAPNSPDLNTAGALPGDKTPPKITDSLGFYSQVGYRVARLNQNTFRADQLANQIRKMPGVKKEELDDLGLLNWLDGQDGKVTKAEVLEFIRSAGPQMEEVTLGDIGSVEDQFARAGYEVEFDEEEDGYIARDVNGEVTYDDYGNLYVYGSPTELIESVSTDRIEDQGGSTKFSEYTLPGGENYREVLLTLPPVKKEPENKLLDFQNRMVAKYGGLWNISQLTPEENAEREGITRSDLDSIREVSKPNEFTSSHFNEPNILAHFRLNDRTDRSGNKVLFIEEIQSDWHQAGKKKGYGSQLKIEPDPRVEGNFKITDQQGQTQEWQRMVSFADQRSAELALGELNSFRRGDAVPDAPFKKTESWSMLAFKRVLRQAVEQGYDSVAWTPGEVQNERYDLSKKIRLASAIANVDGTYNLVVESLDGQEVDPYSRSGKKVTASEMEEIVGKDLTKKLVEGADANKLKPWPSGVNVNPAFFTVQGLDLKIGGEGMKGFYDKILPKAVSKYVKQFGAKVGTTKVVTVPAGGKKLQRIEGFNVRDEEGFIVNNSPLTHEEAGRLTEENFDKGYSMESAGHVSVETTEDDALEVWSLDITPEIKEAVQQGQPRYSVGPSQGSVEGFRLPDPQRDASMDFAVKLLNGEAVNKERAQRIIERMYPGANATSALFTAHALKKQLAGSWDAVRSESMTEAYQMLARTENALTGAQRGIEILEDARRRFEEQYLKGTKDAEVRKAVEERRRQQVDRDNVLTREELESEGLWITDPVAQLDIEEETLKPKSRQQDDQDEDGVGDLQNQDIGESEIQEITEVPQQVNEYLQNLRELIHAKTGLNVSDPDFVRAYRSTLQQAVRGSVRALTYGRTRESLLRAVDRLGDLTKLPSIESQSSKILFKTFQSATYYDRKSLVKQLEKKIRKALGKKRPSVTRSWTRNKLDAAVDRYFRKVRSIKYDIVEEDPDTGEPTRTARKLMDLDLDTVGQRIDQIQNELDTGLEAYYNNEHDRKSISDKIAEMQEDLELLQRYGGLKYKTLAEIQEVFDTTESELDEALRIQSERKELRNKVMDERASLIISAVSTARGKLKRSKLQDAADEWTAYELSLYGRLQDLIRYAEKSDPKVYKALWNKDVVVTQEGGADELWNLSKLARDVDTASHGIRVRKHQSHHQLLDAIALIYGKSNAFAAEGTIHELLKVRDEYRRFSKADNPVPLSKAHLIQYISYMDQEFYHDNAEKYGRLEDYDAIKSELSDQDLQLLTWMRNFYLEQRPELSEKKRSITGLGFPADIDPLYMPVGVKVYNGGLAGVHTALQVTPAIMTDRRKHQHDINENLDVFAIFFDRVHQNAVYLELADTALDVAELFGRKDLQEAISKTYGDKYKDRLYEHLYDVISQKPLTYQAKGTEKFMLAYGALVMNFNLGPAARQPSSGFAFAFDHGMPEVAKWNLQWLSPGGAFNPDHKEFISDMLKSPQAAARFEGGASYEMASMFEAEGVTAVKRIFKKYGMAPNKYVDMLTIAYVGSHVYRKYYEQLVAQGANETAAKAKAMEWTWSEVERHQQSSFLQNQAPWQRRGGGAQKIMGMFGTTVQQFLAEQNRVYRKAQATGDYRELVKHTFINHVVLPVSYKLLDTLFWALFGRKPDEDEWKEYLALMVMGPLGGKFIFRSIMSYAVDSIIQGRPPVFKDNLVPASGMMRIVGDVTQLAWNTDDPEKLNELILDVTGGLLPPVRLMEEVYDNYLSEED